MPLPGRPGKGVMKAPAPQPDTGVNSSTGIRSGTRLSAISASIGLGVFPFDGERIAFSGLVACRDLGAVNPFNFWTLHDIRNVPH